MQTKEEFKMKTLKTKLNKKGFTLAELLIVVAIIAVLVAVSIPIFTSRLEKSREATDIANMRAAKAAVVAAYLSDETVDGVTFGSAQTDSVSIYYDANNGVLTKNVPEEKYGQGTKTKGGSKKYGTYTEESLVKDQVIQASIDTAGKVTLTWVTGE